MGSLAVHLKVILLEIDFYFKNDYAVLHETSFVEIEADVNIAENNFINVHNRAI